MTWNLWWQFGPWKERQPAVSAELQRIQPDVALLQEVWADEDGPDQAAILASDLNMELVRTTAADGSPQKFGNAILSRWPIQSSSMTRLPTEDGAPSHRTALVAVVDTPAGPQPFVVTHLAWQYGAGPLRIRQLEAVVELADEHRNQDPDAPPLVLGGDFNAVPDSDEIRRLTGLGPPFRPGQVFTDCWAAVGDGDGHTWTRDNPHAADALWPRRRLDYVFVVWPRPKPLGNPVSAQLAGTEPIVYDGGPDGGIVPSDHYAVVVDLDDRQTLDHG